MFDDFEDPEDDLGGASELVSGPGLLPPRESFECLGHAAIEERLLERMNGQNMPHALIFAGPVGIGKSVMAFRLARALLKHGTGEDPAQDSMFGDLALAAALTTLHIDPEDRVFRQVASGGHPDIMVVERQMDDKKNRLKASVDVDSVRKVAPFLRMTASEGGWRIVIVNDADTMNRNAQNALLKILEEPPNNALLILIAHRSGALIPTIRSRSRVIPFQKLADEIVMDLLAREYAENSLHEREIVTAMADGSIGRAISIMEEGGSAALDGILDILCDWQDWNWIKIHHLADGLSRPGQDSAFDGFCNMLVWALDSILYGKARGLVSLQAPLDKDDLQTLAAHYSLEEWIKICENLKDHVTQAKIANLDRRQAVIGAFALIA